MNEELTTKRIKEVRKELVEEWNKLIDEKEYVNELTTTDLLKKIHLNNYFISRCFLFIELIIESKENNTCDCIE